MRTFGGILTVMGIVSLIFSLLSFLVLTGIFRRNSASDTEILQRALLFLAVGLCLIGFGWLALKIKQLPATPKLLKTGLKAIFAVFVGYLFWRYRSFTGLNFYYEIMPLIIALWFALVTWFALEFAGFLPNVDQRERSGFMLSIVSLMLFLPFLGAIGTGMVWLVDRGIIFLAVANPARQVCQSAATLPPEQMTEPLGIVWLSWPFGTGDFSPQDINLNTTNSVKELDTLICLMQGKAKMIEQCEYSSGGTFTRYQYSWEVIVVDWETTQVRAKKSFPGDAPGGCPIRKTVGKDESYGSGLENSSSSLREWLASIETGQAN